MSDSIHLDPSPYPSERACRPLKKRDVCIGNPFDAALSRRADIAVRDALQALVQFNNRTRARPHFLAAAAALEAMGLAPGQVLSGLLRRVCANTGEKRATQGDAPFESKQAQLLLGAGVRDAALKQVFAVVPGVESQCQADVAFDMALTSTADAKYSRAPAQTDAGLPVLRAYLKWSRWDPLDSQSLDAVLTDLMERARQCQSTPRQLAQVFVTALEMYEGAFNGDPECRASLGAGPFAALAMPLEFLGTRLVGLPPATIEGVVQFLAAWMSARHPVHDVVRVIGRPLLDGLHCHADAHVRQRNAVLVGLGRGVLSSAALPESKRTVPGPAAVSRALGVLQQWEKNLSGRHRWPAMVLDAWTLNLPAPQTLTEAVELVMVD